MLERGESSVRPFNKALRISPSHTVPINLFSLFTIKAILKPPFSIVEIAFLISPFSDVIHLWNESFL